MKLMKIGIILLVLIMFLSQTILAVEDILSAGVDWDQTGLNKAREGTTLDTSQLQTGSEKLYNLLLVAATIVGIIVGALLGIQYMTAGINKKVEVKASLFPYLISCIVVFGSLGIWKLVVTIMKEIK